MSIELDAYFRRIEWGGATRANLETLAGILRSHMARIPFENLDVLLGRAIRLDAEGLQAKLVGARRGGYCFEHATLLAAVLDELGMHPLRHSARVTTVAPRGASPRTHMILTVEMPEGRFVVDPGFGTLAPAFPVPLVDAGPEPAVHHTHWMVRDGGLWLLRARSGGNVVDAWVSTLEPDNAVDFEMANHYTSTFPASPFVNRLMLRALTPDGRVTVMNRDLTFWHDNTPAPARLADRAALQALLARHFGIDLPEVLGLRVPSIPEWS